MIHEVDEVLRVMLTEQALAGTEVEVAFDAPTKDWAARRNGPTVNLFLYDVQEDMTYREHGIIEEYDEHGSVVATHPPPQYYSLSYLVTAWTNHPTDEHRLLSALLAGLVVHPSLPTDRLPGTLGTMRLTVPMSIAIPPVRERGISELWTALGGALKPSLDLVVTAPLAAWQITGVRQVTDGLRLRIVDTDRAAGPAETGRLRYTGQVAGPAGGAGGGSGDGSGGSGGGAGGGSGDAEPAIPIGVGRDRGTPGRRRQRKGASHPIRPDGQR